MLEFKYWVLIAIAGVVLFMILHRSVKKPLIWMWYGLLYTAVGGLALYVINLVGQYVDLYIPINPITAFITGVLGIPGVAYLVTVKLLFIS